AGADPQTLQPLAHVIRSYASWSVSTTDTSSSSTVSAAAPSADSTTTSPPRTSSPMTDRMELAGTGSPPSLAMVTASGCRAAAWTNSDAGRACRPTFEPTMALRVAITHRTGCGQRL